MARRKLAQWWVELVLNQFTGCFGLLMPECLWFLFQVSTKEVIKFQMVSWLFVSFKSLWFYWWRGTLTMNDSSQAYSNLLRAHMDGLKKKDKKSKSKKTKATQWATDSWLRPQLGSQTGSLPSERPPLEAPPITVHPTSDSFDITPSLAWSTLIPGCSVPSATWNRRRGRQQVNVSTLQPCRPLEPTAGTSAS